MATITPTITRLNGDDSVIKVVWANMANGDVGAPFPFVQWADRTVHMYGTFSVGGTVQFKGSGNSGTSYIVLTDGQGNTISKTTESIEAVTEVIELARPEVTAGDGSTSITVSLTARRDGSRRGS